MEIDSACMVCLGAGVSWSVMRRREPGMHNILAAPRRGMRLLRIDDETGLHHKRMDLQFLHDLVDVAQHACVLVSILGRLTD